MCLPQHSGNLGFLKKAVASVSRHTPRGHNSGELLSAHTPLFLKYKTGKKEAFNLQACCKGGNEVTRLKGG